MDKKSKILITILIISIILIIGVISIVIIFDKDDKENKNELKNQENEKIEQIIQKLNDISYKYYSLKEGHLNMGEATIEIDGVIYTAINDSSLTTLDDIYNLIDNNFIEKFSDELYNDVFEKHKFIELNNTLYVNLSEDTCEIDYELDFDKVEYEKVGEDKLFINFGSKSFYAYYEDNNWKLRFPFYYCDLSIANEE